MAADLDRAYVINGDDLRIALAAIAGAAGFVKNPGETARNILSEHARPLSEGRYVTRADLAKALGSTKIIVHDKDGLGELAGSFRADTLVTRAKGRVWLPEEHAVMLLKRIAEDRAAERDPWAGDSYVVDADICDHVPVDPEVAAMAALAPALPAVRRLKYQEAMRVMRWATDRATDSLPPF